MLKPPRPLFGMINTGGGLLLLLTECGNEV